MIRGSLLLAALSWLLVPDALSPGRAHTAAAPVLHLQPESVSTGNGYTCGLRLDSSVICWGNDASGQVDSPLGEFLSVSTGGSDSGRTCGIRPNEDVMCWGAHSGLAPPGRFRQVSTGGYVRSLHRGTGCGLLLTDRVECWSIATRRGHAVQSVSVRRGYFSQVSAGGGFACGVRRDRTISCWGSKRIVASMPPVRATKVVVWGSIYPSHSLRRDYPAACALTLRGAIRCWGQPGTDVQSTPRVGRFSDVALGQSLACGLNRSREAVCWGPPGAASVSLTNTAPVASVSAGNGFVCEVLASTAVTCVHDGYQTAGGWTAETAVPGVPFRSVSAGAWYDCGVRLDDSLVCWGTQATLPNAPPGSVLDYSLDQGSEWGCGTNLEGSLRCPGSFPPPPRGRFVHVAVDSDACAISRSNQEVRCWGGPMAPAPVGHYRTVAVGVGYTAPFACALTLRDRARCWGDNRSTESGRTNGQTQPPHAPLTQIVATYGGACGLMVDARAICWGDSGRVGAGPFTRIAMGLQNGHTPWRLCGIRLDGALACAEKTGSRRFPGGPYVSLSAGLADVCAVDALGGVRCWGGARVRIPPLTALSPP